MTFLEDISPVLRGHRYPFGNFGDVCPGFQSYRGCSSLCDHKTVWQSGFRVFMYLPATEWTWCWFPAPRPLYSCWRSPPLWALSSMFYLKQKHQIISSTLKRIYTLREVARRQNFQLCLSIRGRGEGSVWPLPVLNWTSLYRVPPNPNPSPPLWTWDLTV